MTDHFSWQNPPPQRPTFHPPEQELGRHGGQQPWHQPGQRNAPQQPGGQRTGPQQAGGRRNEPQQPGWQRTGPQQPGGQRTGPQQQHTGERSSQAPSRRAERDPYEETRPDPRRTESGGEGGEADEPTRESRLRSGERRLIELVVLVTLAAGLLAVQWADQKSITRSMFGAGEKVTVVPRGTTKTLGDAEWRLLGQTTAPALGSRDPEVVQLQVSMAVKPLSPAAAKAASTSVLGFAYRVRDPDGREWKAIGPLGQTMRPGTAYRVTYKVRVPRSKASSLSFEVLAPQAATDRGKAPRPSLRFAP